MSVYQISVFLENRAGQLAEITGILAEQGVDLRAISIAETSDYGILRMIVDDATRTKEILTDKGYIHSMTPVLVVEAADQPGGLAPILAILAENNLDIKYMYSLFTYREGKSYMVFRVSDEERFKELLAEHGITTVDAADLGLK